MVAWAYWCCLLLFCGLFCCFGQNANIGITLFFTSMLLELQCLFCLAPWCCGGKIAAFYFNIYLFMAKKFFYVVLKM